MSPVTKSHFNVSSHQFQLSDRYNVAPSMTVPVVRSIDGGRVMSGMHWGLIPFWAKDKKIAYKTINARAETVAIKPAFTQLIKLGVACFRSAPV